MHIIVSYDQNISLIFLFKRWIPCQASTSVLRLHYRPVTIHCSTKGAYTSEITFLALNPCALEITNVYIVLKSSSMIGVMIVENLYDFNLKCDLL